MISFLVKEPMTYKQILFFAICLLSQESRALIQTGHWSTLCQNGVLREQLYTAHSVLTIENFFSDRICQVPAVIFETAGQIEYPATSTTGDIFPINFTYSSIKINLKQQSLVSDFNTRNVCGFSDWAIGKAREISGLSCALFSENPSPVPEQGQSRYGIYSQRGQSLFYGRMSTDYDSSTPAKRPQELNLSIEYIFQNSL